MNKNKQYSKQNEWNKENIQVLRFFVHKNSLDEMELIQRLEFYAKESNKSRNQCIKEAIDEYLSKREY